MDDYRVVYKMKSIDRKIVIKLRATSKEAIIEKFKMPIFKDCEILSMEETY